MNEEDLKRLVRSAASDRFADGFSERVMRRVSSDSAEAPFAAILQRQFVRLAPPAAAAVVAVAAFNVFGARTADQSIVEAALGVEPVKLDAGLNLFELSR